MNQCDGGRLIVRLRQIHATPDVFDLQPLGFRAHFSANISRQIGDAAQVIELAIGLGSAQLFDEAMPVDRSQRTDSDRSFRAAPWCSLQSVPFIRGCAYLRHSGYAGDKLRAVFERLGW
jgi:hypothetical protein